MKDRMTGEIIIEQEDREELEIQLRRTSNPYLEATSIMGQGEHFNLRSILNGIGYRLSDNKRAYDIAYKIVRGVRWEDDGCDW